MLPEEQPVDQSPGQRPAPLAPVHAIGATGQGSSGQPASNALANWSMAIATFNNRVIAATAWRATKPAVRPRLAPGECPP